VNTSEAVQALLQEIQPVYQGIQELRACWDALQTVEQARGEYQALFAEEDGTLAALRGEKDRLESQKRQLLVLPRWDEEPVMGRLYIPGPPDDGRPRTGAGPGTRPPAPAPPPAARSRLKKLVNRWAPAWRLDPDKQGRINRIIDEADSPLGEALALLDWEVYQDSSRTGANPEEHLERLREWRAPLVAYREQLQGDVAALRTRYGPELGLWELWRARDQSPEGGLNWDAFIAATRRAKQDEITRLRDETSRLADELAALKLRRPYPEGGQP
jgi:hypothetical protein